MCAHRRRISPSYSSRPPRSQAVSISRRWCGGDVEAVEVGDVADRSVGGFALAGALGGVLGDVGGQGGVGDLAVVVRGRKKWIVSPRIPGSGFSEV
jgi:uncharacterized membrane protein